MTEDKERDGVGVLEIPGRAFCVPNGRRRYAHQGGSCAMSPSGTVPLKPPIAVEEVMSQG